MRDHRLDWIWEHAMKYQFGYILNELEEVFSTEPPTVSSRNVLLCYQIVQQFTEDVRNEEEDIWSASYLQKYVQTLLATFQPACSGSQEDLYLHQKRFDLSELSFSELTRLFLCLKLLILVSMVQNNGCKFSASYALRNFGFKELPDFFHGTRKAIEDDDQTFFETIRNLALWIVQDPPAETLDFILRELKPIVVQYSRILAPCVYVQIPCTVIEYMHLDRSDDYSYLNDPILHLLLSTVRQWSRIDQPTCQQDLLNVIKHIQDKMAQRDRKADELRRELWDDSDRGHSSTLRYFPATFRKSILPSRCINSADQAKSTNTSSSVEKNTSVKLNALRYKFVSDFASETMTVERTVPPQIFVWDPCREKIQNVKFSRMLRPKSIPSVVELVSQLRKESTLHGDRLQTLPVVNESQPSQEDLIILKRIVSNSQNIPDDFSHSAETSANEEAMDTTCESDDSLPENCKEKIPSASANSSMFQCKQEPSSPSSVVEDSNSSSENGSPDASRRINRILLRALNANCCS